MAQGVPKRKQDASNNFAAMFDGKKKPSPEQVIAEVMHGDLEYTDRQIEAAKLLLPYRLPRLATVEAHVAKTEMSHEEWIASLDGDNE